MSPSVDPVRSFRPDAEAKCLCGKNRLFKNCCGNNSPDRDLPFGMILKKKFLPDSACDKLIAYAEKQGVASDLAVVTGHTQETQQTEDQVNSDRVTSRIDLGQKQATIDKWVADIFYKVVAKRTGEKIRSYSPPDLMRYKPGGHYKAHSDSELFDPAAGVWNKVLDRDYSLLLYLNSDFEGGAVYFDRFNYTYQPEKGDLLIFPSHQLYLHEAQLVTKGVRYVIVSWANIK